MVGSGKWEAVELELERGKEEERERRTEKEKWREGREEKERKERSDRRYEHIEKDNGSISVGSGFPVVVRQFSTGIKRRGFLKA